MIHIFDTTVELAGVKLPCKICYELDACMGWPEIETVEIGKTMLVEYDEHGYYSPKREWFSIDVTKLLDEEQIKAMEDEINTALAAEALENRIEAAELRRLEKSAA